MWIHTLNFHEKHSSIQSGHIGMGKVAAGGLCGNHWHRQALTQAAYGQVHLRDGGIPSGMLQCPVRRSINIPTSSHSGRPKSPQGRASWRWRRSLRENVGSLHLCNDQIPSGLQRPMTSNIPAPRVANSRRPPRSSRRGRPRPSGPFGSRRTRPL